MPPQSREHGTPLELTIKLSKVTRHTATADLDPLELDMFEITRRDSLVADNADGCASNFAGRTSDGERALVQCEIFRDPHGTCGKKMISANAMAFCQRARGNPHFYSIEMIQNGKYMKIYTSHLASVC